MKGFEHRQRMAGVRSKTLAFQYAIVAALAVGCVVTFFLTLGRRPDSKPARIDVPPDWRAEVEAPVTMETAASPNRLIDAGLLLGVEDINPVRTVPGAGGLKASIIDPVMLGKILKEAGKKSVAELREMAIRDLEYDRFNDPQTRMRVRGCVLLFRGSLRRFEKSDLPPEALKVLRNFGVNECYEGEIQDAQLGLYSFRCLENVDRKWENGDVVELIGVFYKLIKYPSRAGKEQGAPLLVARKLIFVPPAVRSPTASLVKKTPDWAIALALAVAAFVIILAMNFLMRPKRTPLAVSSEGLEGLRIEFASERPPEEAAPDASETPEPEVAPEDAASSAEPTAQPEAANASAPAPTDSPPQNAVESDAPDENNEDQPS